ncbi:MAG TPA: tetratricopeptide repeat protein, partial [Longimicrobiaceae bacterium]|nr:tetratricopeptide repeat protein [Longimicrobiaceae bacterium]
MPDLGSVLDDGIRYLRLGSLERAWSCFEAAAHATRDPAIRSEARRRQADVLRRRGQWDDALRLADDAVQIARAHALREQEAAARNIEGTIHLQRGEFEDAVAIFSETLEIEPSARQRGLICQNLGTAHAQQGLYDAAVEWYARSSEAFAAG